MASPNVVTPSATLPVLLAVIHVCGAFFPDWLKLPNVNACTGVTLCHLLCLTL